MTSKVAEQMASFAEGLTMKFSGGEGFPPAASTTKVANSGHGNGNEIMIYQSGMDLPPGYDSSTHRDASYAERVAFDTGKEVLVNVGATDGTRASGGIAEVGTMKYLGFYDRHSNRNATEKAKDDARISSVEHARLDIDQKDGLYNMGRKWVCAFNGPIRHKGVQRNEEVQVYHQGGSTGPCFHVLVTFTRDLNKVEVKWVMLEIAKLLNRVEKLFS